MPRTRAQAQAQEVESPLVSLEIPRRRRRIASATPSKSSADTKKATDTKPKRGRKPTKKATVVATEKTTEEKSQNKSEIEAQEPLPIQTPTQEPQWTQETPQIQEVPVVQAPQTINEAQDNGLTDSPAFATPQLYCDSDASSLTSLGSTPSYDSPAKKPSVRNALRFLKQVLKQSRSNLRKTTIEGYPTFETNYSLAENEILDAALEIVLYRQNTDPFKSWAQSIRCPCCRGVVKMECVRGHDLHSWIPNEVTEELNAVLMHICAEGIVATVEAKEKRLRAGKDAEAAAKAKAAQLVEQEKKEVSAKQKGKKRALESNNDENITDALPRAQRRRIRPPPGQTPRSKRRIPTTNPGRTLTYAETVRQRAMERESSTAQSSIFQLDEAMTHLREQEQAKKAAQEAAEEEARNAITRKAMERHMVLGPIPENLQSSFQVPVYKDEYDVEDDEEENRPVETPTSNNWGLRSFFTTVTGSVRRRLIPFVRQAPDQAVPFAAGGGATPGRVNGTAAASSEVNGAAVTSTESNGTQDVDVDMTYSLFPRAPSPPRPAPSSEAEAKADKQKDEAGKTTATDKENVQVPGTEQTSQNKTNGEPQNADAQAESETGSHKRKRAPSPDMIPNPAGCSYGMDLDYFTYSDDEIEEAEEYSRRQREAEAAAAKSTVSAPTARPPEKKARFLPSEPEPSLQTTSTTTQTHWQPPTPAGWARPTTTVYEGQMFQGMTHPAPTFPFNPFHPTPDWRTVPTPLVNPYMQPIPPMQPLPKTFPQSGSLLDLRKAAAERRLASNSCLKIRNNRVNNGPGTPTNRFPQPQVSQPAQQPVAQPSPVRTTAQQPILQSRVEQPAQQIIQQPYQQPSVQAPVQQQTQQTPQQQRSTGALSNGVSSKPPHDRSITAATKQNPGFTGKPGSKFDCNAQQDQEDLMQVFGDDEHGRQAFELYQSCPSGDLSKVQWPSFDLLPANNIQQTTRLTSVSAGHPRASRNLFQKSFEQFQNEFNQGLIDTDEILGDLPL
uniref:Glutamyl-tRNA reductase n=1 Tax=Talaromyces marneffei PM1 TaxID=1077442 RepID=A0A093VGZ6_TALMA